MRFHMLQNAQMALDFLRYKKIKLVNIRAEDIVDGNPKLTLGLIWTIILHFQVSFKLACRGCPTSQWKQCWMINEFIDWAIGAKLWAPLRWAESQSQLDSTAHISAALSAEGDPPDQVRFMQHSAPAHTALHTSYSLNALQELRRRCALNFFLANAVLPFKATRLPSLCRRRWVTHIMLLCLLLQFVNSKTARPKVGF